MIPRDNAKRELIRKLLEIARLKEVEVAKLLGISRQRVHQLYTGYKSYACHQYSYKDLKRVEATGGFCRVCGEEHNLKVHHIDHDYKNNLPNNLIVLCTRCHEEKHHNLT